MAWHTQPHTATHSHTRIHTHTQHTTHTRTPQTHRHTPKISCGTAPTSHRHAQRTKGDRGEALNGAPASGKARSAMARVPAPVSRLDVAPSEPFTCRGKLASNGDLKAPPWGSKISDMTRNTACECSCGSPYSGVRARMRSVRGEANGRLADRRATAAGSPLACVPAAGATTEPMALAARRRAAVVTWGTNAVPGTASPPANPRLVAGLLATPLLPLPPLPPGTLPPAGLPRLSSSVNDAISRSSDGEPRGRSRGTAGEVWVAAVVAVVSVPSPPGPPSSATTDTAGATLLRLAESMLAMEVRLPPTPPPPPAPAALSPTELPLSSWMVDSNRRRVTGWWPLCGAWLPPASRMGSSS